VIASTGFGGKESLGERSRGLGEAGSCPFGVRVDGPASWKSQETPCFAQLLQTGCISSHC
jgi:hypothetical protein